MKPVPFAQYLERQQKTASRADAVVWPPREQVDAGEKAPRNSPLLRRLEKQPVEPKPAMAQRIDQTRQTAFEEGREAARQELAQERVRLRDALNAEIEKARAQWFEEEGERLAAAHRSALEAFETRCAQSVANILRPFLTRQVIARVTESLVENLEVLFASRTRALFEVRGPQDMLDALREKFAARDISVSFEPNDSMDIKVCVDDTIIETQLGAWMKALGALTAEDFMSDDEKPQEIIIVRRRVEGEEGHHGGAWKIAYADFVTAMMAFFLVLWILNSTNKDSQTIIARYFNPVKMEDFAKNKKGIREAQQKEEKPGSDEGEADMAPAAGAEQGKMQQRGKDPNKDSSAKAMMNDETLFQNPYAALDQIAGKAPAQNQKSGSSAAGEAGTVDAFRDPFRASGMEPEEAAETPAAPAAPSAPNASSAQGAQGAQAAGQTAASAAAADGKAVEEGRAAAMQKDLVKGLKGEGADGAPRLDVKATDEGLLISLTDNENFGMFEVGSSSPKSKLVHLMERIAQSLKDQPGGIVLRGYTDGRRYRSGSSDNWRLSASRAQMALYMLTRGGLPEARVERVEGYADHNLKLPDKPEAAENRRIEILLRKASP